MASDLDVDDLFPSKFFKAERDLGEEGAELSVTIADIGVEPVGREKEKNPSSFLRTACGRWC
jgi:predicted DNA-binding ribbon-helix-helix protein